ncbi:FixH family protein [uncultured Pontibacter sp.]|uniref:FixH family protein n=1 Tax=uncultured Pontibacter sp. TaxID=453356 RepID=UPI0026203724|nr:FixH family protein [uncultured Pontibacter sp.]
MKLHTCLTMWALCLATLFITGCDSNSPTPEPTTTYNKIAEGQTESNVFKVKVYSTESELTTGYNPLHVAVYDAAGKRVEEAGISFMPLMDMMTMKHATPFENPASEKVAEGYFSGAVVFTMPSGEMGAWSLTVSVTANGQTDTVTLPITVQEPATSRLKSFVSATDGTRYYVAYLQPQQPKIGVNDLEVAVYKMNTMMDFPAATDLTMELDPEMPSMGHGSPNNQNPTHTSNGHYKGKVNFTMTGLWYLNLTLNDASGQAGQLYFEVNF